MNSSSVEAKQKTCENECNSVDNVWMDSRNN